MEKITKVGFLGFLLVILMVPGLSYAGENEYPSRPISLIIPGAAGSVTDLISRTFAEYASPLLGQSVVSVNKPGGGQLIGGNVVATSKPDGYTLGMQLLPSAIPEVYRYFHESPYTSADLKPISKVANFVGVIIVKSEAPWNNLKEVVEYVRKNPGMKFGITARGGSPHLVMLTIEKVAKIKFTELPNASDSDVIMQILGGHIPIGLVAYASGKAQIVPGNLKVLALYGVKRFELLPEVPTIGELGYVPSHYAVAGLFAPKGTPEAIVQKVAEVTKKVSEIDLFRQKYANLGLQVDYEDSNQFQETLNLYKVDIGNYLKQLGYVK
jgi:tripartite-type tricarboxylate transporter receptor subunit TctC